MLDMDMTMMTIRARTFQMRSKISLQEVKSLGWQSRIQMILERKSTRSWRRLEGLCIAIFSRVPLTFLRGAKRPGGEDPVPQRSRFTGSGQTLGGDDIPSEVVPDPNADIPKPRELVKRVLKIWTDGFSVDDGPLYAFSDPKNKDVLDLISEGRAPLHIMNVDRGQPVDVSLEKLGEPYKAPKRKFQPFSGQGKRLGSPTPGTGSAPPAPEPGTSTAPPSTTSTAPAVELDDSQPILSIQIRLGDGTRLVARFNPHHTIGDLYNFVTASNPASAQRSWVLMTTFPSKELADREVKLGDLAEFKRGGVVVQKWQ
jgi:UBX domain-containing protein 1